LLGCLQLHLTNKASTKTNLEFHFDLLCVPFYVDLFMTFTTRTNQPSSNWLLFDLLFCTCLKPQR
jgi:hypothetical protein